MTRHLLRAELVKQWHRPRTYALSGLMMLVPVVAAIAIKLNPPTLGGRDDAFSFFTTGTGLLLPVAVLRFLAKFFLVVVVVLVAGDAVASEARWGNLRSTLTRPVGRGRLLVAKAGSSACFGVVTLLLTLATALLAGIVGFGWHPLDVAGVHQSQGEILANLALMSVYVLWGTAAFAALAFMVSTMVDSPVLAALAGFGLYVASLLLDNITSLGVIRSVLPTHDAEAWTTLFVGTNWGPTVDMVRGALVQLAYVVVFAGIAWRSFRRRDICW
jgi:ABC-2 type transport system permease protein